MKKLLVCLFCLMPFAANAEITYRVQKTWEERGENATRDTFASRHRFYAGAMYNFSIWQDYTTDDNITADGRDTSGFDVMLGIRWFDTFRIEANYFTDKAKWNGFSIKTNTAFLNLLVDARIDSLYRMFYKQKLIPYMGAGVGATWTSGDSIAVDNDTVPSFTVMAISPFVDFVPDDAFAAAVLSDDDPSSEAPDTLIPPVSCSDTVPELLQPAAKTTVPATESAIAIPLILLIYAYLELFFLIFPSFLYANCFGSTNRFSTHSLPIIFLW